MLRTKKYFLLPPGLGSARAEINKGLQILEQLIHSRANNPELMLLGVRSALEHQVRLDGATDRARQRQAEKLRFGALQAYARIETTKSQLLPFGRGRAGGFSDPYFRQSRDGKWLTLWRSGTIEVWEVASGRITLVLPYASCAWSFLLY
jgi:hypothetical protein